MLISIREYIDQIRERMEMESAMKEKELMMAAHLKDAQLKYLQAQINNNIRLSVKKDWYLGVNYFYTSALQLEVGKLKSFQNLNLSVKKIYHQWTFSLEVQDVFNTSKINIKDQDDYGNIFTVYQNQHNQKMVLGATYNFGNQKLKKMIKSDNANEEIKSRTNN